MAPAIATSSEPTTAEVTEALEETRQRTLELVAPIDDEDLERVHSALMSPLVWDLGHIAAFEDLWLVHRYGARPLLRDDLMDVYDAFGTPRADRGELPFLRSGEAREYLDAVRTRTLDVLTERGSGDGFLHELVVRHEQQHNETMLQTLALARLDGYVLRSDRSDRGAGGCSDPRDRSDRGAGGYSDPRDRSDRGAGGYSDPRDRSDRGAGGYSDPRDRSDRGAGGYSDPRDRSDRGAGGYSDAAESLSGLELTEVPAGGCTIGAPDHGFAYDNERPRHRTDVRGYLIGRAPVTNATYLTFVEGGGYERREWWSAEGWAWKEQYDISRPGAWTSSLDGEWRVDGLHPLHPDRPVVHVSWFEADAFARAHGVRLPTETEWEKAATWDQIRQTATALPWGDMAGIPGRHANFDQIATGPLPVTHLSEGVSPYGCLGMVGDTWEWTATNFTGYPGFQAHPYREYSEVFFGRDYKVLRGGSWATGSRVITAAFRNWDYPQRRQIFAGIRIARDL